MALRGDEEQWWELYHAARRDPKLRALLARLLQRADPDAGWRTPVAVWLLLARMRAPPSRTSPSTREAGQRSRRVPTPARISASVQGRLPSCPQWPYGNPAAIVMPGHRVSLCGL